jgi:hypothetical protein
MQRLNPRALNNPKNWREAYNAFLEFRGLAHKLGEPIQNWSLEYPSSLKEKMKGNWRITYTLGGKVYTSYVGYDGLNAAAGIKTMIKSYPKHDRRESKAPKQEQARKMLLVEDASLIAKLWSEYQQVITKVGKSVSPAQFENDYKFHSFMLSRRAGILDMDMLHYLTTHPHAQYWPAPAQSREEYDRRTRELQEIVRQKEARKREDQGR